LPPAYSGRNSFLSQSNSDYFKHVYSSSEIVASAAVGMGGSGILFFLQAIMRLYVWLTAVAVAAAAAAPDDAMHVSKSAH
jgi:hypothetical protein